MAAIGLLLTAALAGETALVRAAPPDPPGNNGTVKIHQGAVDDAANQGNGNDIDNDPHVCTFHLHFFFADAGQTGAWYIESWPPTGARSVVLQGTYTTKANGEDRQPEEGAYSLPDGHYKLFWEGSTDKTWKQKVFWVSCGPASPSPSASVEASASPSASVEASASPSASVEASASPSASVEASGSPSMSASPSASVEASTSPSASVEASGSPSMSASPSASVEASGAPIMSASASPSPSPSEITTGGGENMGPSPSDITTGAGEGEGSVLTGEVQGITGTPPATDGSSPVDGSSPFKTLALLLLAISAFAGGISLLAPVRERRR